MLRIVSATPDELPMDLLLEADPSERNIREHLDDSLCYLAMESDEPLGACVLNQIDDSALELYCIAVWPSRQRQGIGTALLRHVIEEAKGKGYGRIELGTGTFGYQLAFYQRAGFRVTGIIRDFFIDNHEEPIFEIGIQLKDMLRLSLELLPPDARRPHRAPAAPA